MASLADTRKAEFSMAPQPSKPPVTVARTKTPPLDERGELPLEKPGSVRVTFYGQM